MSADSFDDAVASVSDFAVSLMTSLPRAERARRAGAQATSALGAIVVAVADARARLPGDDEIVTDLDRARASLASALGAAAAGDHPLAPLGPALDRTRALAVERTARAAVRVTGADPGPPPLVASTGVPALHRGVWLGVAPRPVAALSFGELPPRPSALPGDDAAAQKTLRRWARDALEELAAAGRLRLAREDEAWTSGRAFEERALVSLDMLASLGRGASNDERIDVARVIEDTLHEWSVPDPGRVFAGTFALACFDGHGAAARLHVHARNPHPVTASAVEDALSLGSSPHVHDVVVALLCEDDRPDLLERGLHIARRRRHVPANLAIDLLTHPELRVAIAAARACAAIDPQVARPVLEEALFGPPEVAVHAAESLALLHAISPAWSARLTALTLLTGLTAPGDDDDETVTVRGASADPRAVLIPATRLRVLSAQTRDVDPLLELCGALPREVSLDLLGWLGSATALDLLCSALEDASWNIRERAAWSLARITGAGRDGLGAIEVDEHGDPLHDPDRESFPEGHDHTRRIPPTHPGFWADPIARARAAGAVRLRFGRPLHVSAVVEELIHPATHKGVRRVLVTELAILSSGSTPGLAGSHPPVPIDADDWIARQEQVLALARDAIAPDAGRSSPVPGLSTLGGRR